MGKKLTNNLKLKILSVFLAFFVWLAVTNISNPDVTATKEVPLEVLNEDVLSANGKTYELLDNRSTVTVAYKVRTLDAGVFLLLISGLILIWQICMSLREQCR